ncbi:sugar phosphate isomerase/epimerase [Anaerotruncus sp. AF02-27]|uniref:D-psicose 3-epimerase n=1 Tax=Anaerotruncus sp. AF02-27 TaxID=2292191 RepID=UPI000E54C25B|nr:sugar phosphate isomerase/epimerase family protein [Anaerotruncus sp. AF02-27]RGX54965.1 sugar phosphate isomerase/epimerase [Anaerotruncus sp. AF02-27]
MKFGICYSYFQHSWDGGFETYRDAIPKVARLGFETLEVGTTDLAAMSDDQLETLRRLCEEHGIALTAGGGMGKAHNAASEDESIRKNGVQRLKSFLPAMQKAGVKKMCGVYFGYWMYDYSQPVNKPAAWAQSVKSMREMADAAAQYGIELMLEVVTRYEHFLLNTAAEAVRYVQEVGRPNVKILLDTFHMNIEEDSLAGAIRTAGKHLGHMHIGEANRKLPGKGRLPWREGADALKEIGYQGDLVMEPFVLSNCEVGDTLYLFHDLSDGASDEQLAEDAADSLRFVKGLFV